MLSLTDKQENRTFLRDAQPIDIGNGITQQMSAFLDFPIFLFGTNSKNNIVLVIRTTTNIPDVGTEEEVMRYEGIYSVDGSTLAITLFQIGMNPGETGETKVYGISREGFRLTLEDNDHRITWGKID